MIEAIAGFCLAGKVSPLDNTHNRQIAGAKTAAANFNIFGGSCVDFGPIAVKELSSSFIQRTLADVPNVFKYVHFVQRYMQNNWGL